MTRTAPGRTAVRFVYAEDVPDPVRRQVEDLMAEWTHLDLRDEVHVRRLAGGASNVNLALQTDDAAYALRLCMPESARWGVDRAASIQAQRDAAALGLAPEVLATRLPEGHYLSRFVEGPVLTHEALRRDGAIPVVARTLRRLNTGSTSGRRFSPFDDLRTFAEFGFAEQADYPPDTDDLLAKVLRIEAMFRTRQAPEGFCHSDCVPGNFLRSSAEYFTLVDFDYAGVGWVAFELASFACQLALDATETEELVTSYDPGADAGQRARLELMRFVAGVREAMWAYMAEPILGAHTAPADGWTYRGYAAQNLDQARRAVDCDFDELMHTARTIREGALF
ncbi:phosphotransferase [Modestobacter sp. I12A-02662]|uniref:phosphotransferase n=1 Tax=Modestobacter sp. I12A-02662 TaxID=1730496 RepID=UPI0034DE8E58